MKKFLSENKKKLIIGSVIFTIVAVAVIFAAVMFFQNTKDSYVNVIPANARLLVRVDPKGLLYDNGINISKLLSKANIDEEDIKESGLNFAHPIYAFASKDVEKGLVAKVADKDVAKDFVAEHKKELGFEKDNNIQEDGGDYYISDYHRCIYINNDKILFVDFAIGAGSFMDNGKEASQKARSLMEQDKDNSVYDRTIYEEILASKDPVAINIDFREFPSGWKDMINKTSSLPGCKGLLDSHILITFGIDNDVAAFAMNILPQTDNAKEIFSNDDKSCSKINGDLCGYGMKNHTLWSALSVDGSRFIQLMKDNFIAVRMISKLPNGQELQNVVSSLKGDLIFAYELDKSQDTWLFASQVNNDNAIKTLPGLFNTSEDYQINSKTNEYEVSSDSTSFIFGAQKNLFYAVHGTSPSNILGPNNEKIIKKKEEMKDCYVYMNLNIPSLIKAMKEGAGFFDGIVSGIDAKYLQGFDYAELKMTSITHIEVTLHTIDNNPVSSIVNSWL